LQPVVRWLPKEQPGRNPLAALSTN
jgi:hypothetical protein